MYMDMVALVFPVWCTGVSVKEQAEKIIYKVCPECRLQEAIMQNLMKNKRRGYIPQS